MQLISSKSSASMVMFFLLSMPAPQLLADTITLKSGKNLKGLVVEEHADRIILSTENGEIPLLRSGIKKIDYDDAEKNFLQMGKTYEARNKLGEALAYYEKALEMNPAYEEARVAATSIRSRFWATSTEGSQNEIEKKQAIYDAWGQGKQLSELITEKKAEEAKRLRTNLGLSLSKKGDWVRVDSLESHKDAFIAGLRKNDRLIAIDGQSLRYLGAEAIVKKTLEPRYSNFTLDYERNVFLRGDAKAMDPKVAGFEMKLEYRGLVIGPVKAGSPAEAAGLREEDLVVSINGVSTRYMPLKKASGLVKSSKGGVAVFAVRRSCFLMRK